MNMTIYDIIIVGSGAAGLTAALYSCRAGYQVALVTGSEMFGSLGKISTIENYPGFDSITGYDLALKMYEQLNQFKNLTKFEFINAVNYCKKDKLVSIRLEDGMVLVSRALIIAIGGKHKFLGLKNEEKFIGQGISFCATCDGPLYKDKWVAVIGGGNTAIDFALTLSNYCSHVTIIHRRNELRADKIMVDKVKKLKNVDFMLNTIVKEIIVKKDLSQKMSFGGLVTESENETDLNYVDGCFYALGFDQNNLECIENDSTSNSYQNIYYAGDCIDVTYRQVITACGDGCKAALDCTQYLKSIERN